MYVQGCLCAYIWIFYKYVLVYMYAFVQRYKILHVYTCVYVLNMVLDMHVPTLLAPVTGHRSLVCKHQY